MIIPHFNAAHVYPYWTDGGVVSPGGHPDPGSVLSQLGASWLAKLRTTLLILLPVGFLALGSPLGLVALPSLALRFVSTNNIYWGDGFHYNATVMPIVFLAAMDALSRVRARGDQPWRVAGTGWVAPAVMLGLAVAILPKFPLSGVWQAADVPDQPARPGGGRGAGPGARRDHGGGHADHGGAAGRPG